MCSCNAMTTNDFLNCTSSFANVPTLISLINVEVGINMEGVQKLSKSINVEVGTLELAEILGKTCYFYS